MRYRIEEVRKDQVMSQMELAEKSGVARTTISAIEKGLVDPRPATIKRLAKALGVEPSALVDRSTPAPVQR
jgi:transcriptional regulator with XRE-family HTH domain